MYLLFTRANNLDLPINHQQKLFDKTVLPILTIGSEIWGFENLDIIERIHTDFLRRISKCRKSTPKYILYAEMGRYPIEITIKHRMLSFWARLVTEKTSKLAYNIYLFMMKSPEVDCKWINHIQCILDNSCRHDIWERQPTAVNLSSIGRHPGVIFLETYSVIFSSRPWTTRKDDVIGFQKNDARVPS